jgi:hypothetical protein
MVTPKLGELFCYASFRRSTNSIADPARPVEIGWIIPAPPPQNATHTIQINDVYVDKTVSLTPTTGWLAGSISSVTRVSFHCYSWSDTSQSPWNRRFG